MISGERAVEILTEEVLPFWIGNGVDRDHGGISTCLDRDGTVLDHDKGVWQQFRFAWLLARCERVLGRRPEWTEALDAVLDFGLRHAFDDDGRMFFQLDRLGRPVRRRRYVYSECFASMALAEVAALRGDEELAERARVLLRFVRRAMSEPGVIPPKFTEHRIASPLGHPMISLGVAQVHRSSIGGGEADGVAADAAREIADVFLQPGLEAVLEVAAPDDGGLEHLEGRQLNPGHALEGAWFMMAEARATGDDAPATAAVNMLEWSWRRGWDRVHGGILNFVDLDGGPTSAYEHDMKFWWPQCEAVLAARHVHAATGDPAHLDMARRAEAWAFRHHADRVHPEWFGYLHRDGSRSSRIKGNLWKGPFHLPRMLLEIATLDGTIDPPRPAGGPERP